MEEKFKQEREIAMRRMALFIIILCFGYIGLSSFVIIPMPGKDYSTTIVGILMLLIGYFYGSSSGSTAKSETIDKISGVNPSATSVTATSRTVETVDKRKTETVTEPPVKEEVKP